MSERSCLNYLQALLAQHKGSAQLESQARAVEYGQIFQYGELRNQLLEHMPPLDAAAYARSVAAAGTLNSAPAALVRLQLFCSCAGQIKVPRLPLMSTAWITSGSC